MTIQINSDTDRDDAKRRIAGATSRDEVRTSDARQSRLQRNIRRQSRNWSTEVDIDTGVPTAHVAAEPGEDPEVVITGQEKPQPVTDLDDQAWDWLAQRAFGLHEVGHIRYSDLEHSQSLIDALPRGQQGVAHSLHNAAEDGAIEAQLTRRWTNYYEHLRSLRANLFDANDGGIQDPEKGGQVYPVAHAAQAVTLDLWARRVYSLNIGKLDTLLDEQDNDLHFATEDDRQLFEDKVLPECEALVDAALDHPNARDRNNAMMTHIENICDLLDDADSDGKAQQSGRDGEEDDGASGMPDDSRQNHSGGAESDAEQLGSGEGSGSDSDEEGDSDDAGGSLADIDDIDGQSAGGSLEDVGDVDVSDDLQAEAAEKGADDALAASGGTEELLDEIESLSDACGASGGMEGDHLMMRTDDRDVRPSGWDDAVAGSRVLAQLLRNRLQVEQKSETKRQQRRGRLDSSSLHRSAHNERQVFQREEREEEKDYSAFIVLDRSGSMGGRDIKAAEVQAATLALALEEVGVDVMLVDLENSEPIISSAFGQSSKSNPGNLVNGSATGGTPLTETVELCRERLHQQDRAKQFGIVVTDGRPSSVSNFEAAVRECRFPVLGVTLGSDAEVDNGVYTRDIQASPGGDLQQALKTLVQEVMF